jgi:tRNA-dihydrouridine synthase
MLILAPMQGLTELLFRRVFHRLYPGAFDYAVSPFLSLTHGNLKDAGKKVEDVLPELNADCMPVVPQVLGHEAEGFVDLANRLSELGYSEVNWNMGCPMRRVAAKHRGSGILPYPDEVRSILDYVVPRIKTSLSVKVRLGYVSPDEIDSIIPILNDYPLASVTVHPRTGKQMYSGQVNIEKMKQIAPLIRHKTIYNGDVCSVYDYRRIRSLFPGIKDMMIGRGALYNPLLPMQIRTEVVEDFSSSENIGVASVPTAAQFINALVDAIMDMDVSVQAKVRKIKEYWCLLSKALSGSEEYKRKVLHASDLDAVLRLIDEMTK